MSNFSFADRISKHLSLDLDKAKTTIFDEIIKDVEMYANQPVTGMLQLRSKNANGMKGNLWEEFCLIYLMQTRKCPQVWKLSDIPVDISKELKLPRSQDNGIDLVGYIPNKGYVAIQCKYRSPYSKSVAYRNGSRIFTLPKVTWNSISTFVGLCAQTGPWYQHWIVTNCTGMVSRKVPRTEKDRSICLKSFQNTSREDWISIMKSFSGYSYEEKCASQNDDSKQLSLDELRLARLKRFETSTNPTDPVNPANEISVSGTVDKKE